MNLICTHSGDFHADDVTACALLRIAFGDVAVIRSRAKEDWNKADIVVDVGGIFDPSSNRFDHHFVGSPVRSGGKLDKIPYASAGLIWKHFHATIIDRFPGGSALSTKEKADIHETLDEILIAGIDAMDTGYPLPHSNSTARLTNLTDMIFDMNQPWWEKRMHDNQQHRFTEAVAFVEKVLRHKVESAIRYQDVRKEVRQAYHGGHIIELERELPWRRALVDEGLDGVLFVITRTSDDYRVLCAPVNPDTFELKKKLPADWAGKVDGVLQATTGVQDAIFCHPNRFVVGAKSLEGARALAQLADK